MSKTVIAFKNVTKSFPIYHHLASGIKGFIFNFPKSLKGLTQDRFTALEDISFEIKEGETVGFIGRNGAGKSTTLGLIAQVIRPTHGSISVTGRVSPLLELGGGFHPDLSGLENIQLNGVLLGLSRAEVKAKTKDIIEFSELGQFMDQPIRTYSSGMLSRLGFAVVANLDPKILLVDEVLAVGDLRFQDKCKAKIAEFQKRGVTIILVSHSSQDVKDLCTRAIWIDQHKVKMDGPSLEVVTKYEEAMK